MRTRMTALLACLAVAAAGCGTAQSSPTPTGTPAVTPVVTQQPSAALPASLAPTSSPVASAGTIGLDAWKDPSNFVAVIDNPWLPFKPGVVLRYRGTKDGEPAKVVTTITARTEVVAGVTCVVVDDKLWLSGRLAEATLDYYVQDTSGNVWYFGEDTQELDENGNIISTEGSWHAGVDGAVPGIFMEANPVVGHAFQQEFYKGQAEDHFEVLGLHAGVNVPYVRSRNALLTKEWTPLEPDVLDNKWYVQGIGEVRELAVKGPKEELSLVSVSGL